MKKELKQAIINYIFENVSEFGLQNSTTIKFRLYIFDNDGGWLIGGQEVSAFIERAIKLIKD